MEENLTGISTERLLCCGEGLGIVQGLKMRKAKNLGPLNPNFLSTMMILQSGSSKIFPWTVVSSQPHIKSIYFEERIHTHTQNHVCAHAYIHTYTQRVNKPGLWGEKSWFIPFANFHSVTSPTKLILSLQQFIHRIPEGQLTHRSKSQLQHTTGYVYYLPSINVSISHSVVSDSLQPHGL